MGKSKPPAAGARTLFLFSFHEHEWDVETEEEGESAQLMLQRAHEQNWNAVTGPGRIEEYIDPEVTTIEDLWARVEEVMEDYEAPEGMFEIPFNKLKAKMKAERWKFVSGEFFEFEGNHNDTEIFAVLEKTRRQAATKAATKKAPAKKKPIAKKKPAAKKTPAAKKK